MRRDCDRIFGEEDTKTDTDAVLVYIAEKLGVPLQEDNIIPLSHLVGKPPKSDEDKSRVIIAGIKKYDTRHALIFKSTNLHKVKCMGGGYSVNQKTDKNQGKLAGLLVNGNNLMTRASKLKVDRRIPGETILYLSGKNHM